MHYPQPSRHMPQGIHEGSSLMNQPIAAVPTVESLCDTSTADVTHKYCLNTICSEYTLAELFSKTLAINKLSDKRLWKKEFVTGPICHLELRYKLKSDAAASPLTSIFQLEKNHPRKIIVLMLCVIF